MEKLSKQTKLSILKVMLEIIENDYPQFYEEGTTGYDFVENIKIWREELKQ